MKSAQKNIKVILLWFFAILLTAAHPVETKESFKEIEETEEIKLYVHERKSVKQKPKPKSEFKKQHSSNRHEEENYAFPWLTSQCYILYCSLTYYG